MLESIDVRAEVAVSFDAVHRVDSIPGTSYRPLQVI